MSTTPTLDRPPVQPPETSATIRRYKVWIWVLAVITVLAAVFAVGYATGLIGGDDPEADTPAADEPAAEQPADDQPADDQPADDQPADAPQPPTVRYDEEPRANWDVTGVTADDVLNVRNAPGVDAAIIATLQHDTAELESTGRIAYVGDQLWREIIIPGDSAGWVNATYLTETAPPAEIRYDEEPRANWDVTGVTADDVLNVRNAPGVDAAIIATLQHDTAELESTGRIAYVGDQLWREIIIPGDSAGWVSAAYLTETR